MSLSRSIKVTIGENTYEVKYPTIGQLVDIETKKSALANGMYGQISSMNNTFSNRALDIVDTLSYFLTLIPSLAKDLKGIKTFLDLTPDLAKPLLEAYFNQFKPWFEEWERELYPEKKEEEAKETE